MNSSTRETRGVRRTRGGCPPFLGIDLVHGDALGPAVEWPPAPPSRTGRHTTTRTRDHELDVTELTTGRAIRMLDASVSHLRTALETNQVDGDGERIEQAIADIIRARDTLADLD